MMGLATRHIRHAVLVISCAVSVMLQGCHPDTLVFTGKGFVPLRCLHTHDTLISLKQNGNFVTSSVLLQTCTSDIHPVIEITFEKDEQVIVTEDQKFFLNRTHSWRAARTLRAGDQVMRSYNAPTGPVA